MKKLAVLFAVLMTGPMVYGQTVNQGAPTSIFTNQTISSTYIFSDPVDLQSYDSVNVVITPGTMFPGQLGKIKPQWSQDGTTYVDEPIKAAAPATSTEQPFTFLANTVYVPLVSPTISYTERFQRAGKYFRMAVGSTNATTSATLTIKAQQMNNHN